LDVSCCNPSASKFTAIYNMIGMLINVEQSSIHPPERLRNWNFQTHLYTRHSLLNLTILLSKNSVGIYINILLMIIVSSYIDRL
jgi:hypothetical protein